LNVTKQPKLPEGQQQQRLGSKLESHADEFEPYARMGLEHVLWRDSDPAHDCWLYAFEAIDQRNNKGPLLELLRSGRELPAEARRHLADLIDRYQLKKKKGRSPTPEYERPFSVVRLEWAVEEVREIRETLKAKARRAGEKIEARTCRDDALSEVSKRYGIHMEELAQAVRGQLGSFNKMKKRR
jgi:hypothetical protein